MRDNSSSPAPEGREPGGPYRGSQPSTSEAPIISIERVSKRFSDIYALRNITMQVRRGEVYCLLGPAGAGKSTLLRLLLGFLHPDSGSIRLFDSTNLTTARSRIGYLPEQPCFHENFTGQEYLQFQAELAGYRGHEARQVAGRVIEACGLAAVAGRRIGSYTKETLRRFSMAVALATTGGAPPDLLVLDEPSADLSPEALADFRSLILECNRYGSTVLMCSHSLTDIERTCSTVGILRGGRLLVQTEVEDGPRVHVAALPREGSEAIIPQLIQYLRNLHPGVMLKGGNSHGEPLLLSLPTGPAVPHAIALKAAALRAVIDARWDITTVYLENKDLETLYMQAIQPPTQPYNEPAGPRITEPPPSPARAETEIEKGAGTETGAGTAIQEATGPTRGGSGNPTSPLYTSQPIYAPESYKSERESVTAGANEGESQSAAPEQEQPEQAEMTAGEAAQAAVRAAARANEQWSEARLTESESASGATEPGALSEPESTPAEPAMSEEGLRDGYR